MRDQCHRRRAVFPPLDGGLAGASAPLRKSASLSARFAPCLRCPPAAPEPVRCSPPPPRRLGRSGEPGATSSRSARAACRGRRTRASSAQPRAGTSAPCSTGARTWPQQKPRRFACTGRNSSVPPGVALTVLPLLGAQQHPRSLGRGAASDRSGEAAGRYIMPAVWASNSLLELKLNGTPPWERCCSQNPSKDGTYPQEKCPPVVDNARPPDWPKVEY